jgi:hypothetical protein
MLATVLLPHTYLEATGQKEAAPHQGRLQRRRHHCLEVLCVLNLCVCVRGGSNVSIKGRIEVRVKQAEGF